MKVGAECPKCGKAVSSLEPVVLKISEGFHRHVANAVAYVCPHCRIILGAEQDPQSVFSDIRAIREHLLPKPRS